MSNLHYEKFADGTVKCVEDEIPFELPEGWAWERLGNISTIARGGSPRPIKAFITDDANGINWIKIGDTEKDGKYIFSTKEKIKPEGVVKSRFVKSGDFLLTNSMSFGRPYILKTDGCIHDGWLVIGDIDLVFNQDYLYYALSANYMYQTMAIMAGGSTVDNLNSDLVKSLLFPIPPINEQEAIAHKVSDLLDLVELIKNSEATIVGEISLLKSKILDLAIRGKLVPQNPSDEPASVLLDRIRAEKEELIKQGKIKRDKKESLIFKGEDNSYYVRAGEQVEDITAWELDDLPESWGICALGEICDYGSCTNVETDQISDDEWILDLEDIEKDSGTVLRKVRKIERNAVSTKHKFSKGQVLYSKLRPYLNKVVLADEDGYCTSEILPLDFSEIIIPAYARYYLMSPTFLRYADRCSYGVKMPRLSTTDGKKAVFTVPPINEQIRIVETIETAFTQLDAIAESLN